ncbi:hypothetical protein BC834DRAFT_1039322 [Gloeopeniophorella convolvens]|nr:hypothetical protein BC834DRAFT_1039322 [Gloeopeniophorella convolvens]
MTEGPQVIEDIAGDLSGDLDLWIGKGKKYKNVPQFVSAALCSRVSVPEAVHLTLPSSDLTILEFIKFPLPNYITSFPFIALVDNVGTLSFLEANCYQRMHGDGQFRLMQCPATRTTKFTYVPALSILCRIPKESVRRSASGNIVQFTQTVFVDIFRGLTTEKEAVAAAVKKLSKPSTGRRLGAAYHEDDGAE